MERSARLILLLDYARCVVSPAHQISPGNGLTLLAPVLAVPSLSFLQLQRVSHFRMGILVITWNYPPRRGGMEYLVSNVVRGLRKRHSVCVITAHAKHKTAQEECIYRAPWPGLVLFPLYALWRGAAILRCNPEIKLIFGGSVMVTPLVLILARLFGRKAVVQAHGLDVIHASGFYQTVCVRWLRFCDRIIANSIYTESLVAEKMTRPGVTSVIPPGVDPIRFESAPSPELVKEKFGLVGKRIILFVGRLAKRKGVKEFIDESLMTIAKEVPNVCFVIVGDNPSESLTHREDTLSEIKRIISDMSLQNYIRLLGSLNDDEVIELYQACDVFVLPALATTDDVEGFGIVLLEAAAAGKVVVATRVGGIPDAVEDGKSGILVEAGDHAALQREIIDLLRDDCRRLDMAAYARERVVKQFSWNRIFERYTTILGLLMTPTGSE